MMQKKRIKRYLVIILFISIPLGYTLWDMRQAQGMAADACAGAVKGESLDTYLSTLPEKDFRIIMSDKECILVPKKGMGRYQCVVTHDGRTITGAKTGFLD